MSAPSLPAETAAAPSPKYKRLTIDQRVAILKLHKLGKTQVEIAATIGCDQTSVSRWLIACRDTTAEAITYARGSALPLVDSIVRHGKPADHLQLLKGIGVLAETPQTGLNIFIGGTSTDVQIVVPRPLPASTDRDR
jgi:hypothetical protein